MNRLTKRTILLAIASIASLTLASCAKEEVVWDHPYIIITDEFNTSSATVNQLGTFVATYSVKMSTKAIDYDVAVKFEVKAGNGLTEGVDYKVITSGGELNFPPGVYVRPLRIEWLSNAIDPSKDNTLTIALTSNSANFTIGYPGPAHNNAKYVITKVAD